jgi:hypothetical protein
MSSVSTSTVYLTCSNLVKYLFQSTASPEEKNSRTANKARILCLSGNDAPGTIVSRFSARADYAPRAAAHRDSTSATVFQPSYSHLS